ncbi:restriction endonuclease subunit S [Oxalobacteraceae bacterium OTU3REALA1]|nr:restriction endonuclease subunit S [Oxalobacteraceae bacterium OTU3REALA1]
MSAIPHLLTEHFDLWTAAEPEKKSRRGRASNTTSSVYGIRKLRELILELAVRGRLIPQDTSDEPADELLKRVHSQRDKLVAESKIKKRRAMPPISREEIPFDLPQSWKWIRLNDLLTKIGAGSTPLGGKQVYLDEGIPFLRSQNIWDQGLKLDDVAYISQETHFKMSGTHVFAGDLLFNITGASIGRCAIVPEDFETGNVSQHVTIIRPASKDILRFVHLVLISRHVQKMVMDVQVGVSREGLSIAKLAQFIIPIPPLDEQRRIVAKVDELMMLCDQLETRHCEAADAKERLVKLLLETLIQSQSAADFDSNWQRVAAHFDTLFTTEESIDALKKTLIQLAIIGKLVAQNSGDEPVVELLKRITQERERKVKSEGSRTGASETINASEAYLSIPENWAYFRLGNLARFIDYRGKTPNKIDSGVPLITAKNVRFGYISREPQEFISKDEYTSWMTRGFPQPGDLLFTTEAPLGNIAVIDIFEEFALAQRVICFQLHDKSIGNFLKYALMSDQVQQRLVSAATGMTATGIRASKLKEILIPIPPIQEQFRIVAKVDELTALCEKLKSRVIDASKLQKEIADVFVVASTGMSNVGKKYSSHNADTMKITTTLELHSQANPSIVEPLAKIIASLGGAADAKEVWKKSKLNLPDFYNQLKVEMESGLIRRPQPANFNA